VQDHRNGLPVDAVGGRQFLYHRPAPVAGNQSLYLDVPEASLRVSWRPLRRHGGPRWSQTEESFEAFRLVSVLRIPLQDLRPAILARVEQAFVGLWRDGIIESRHEAHVAVANEQGELVARAGNPERLTVLHSVAKPWQARAFLQSGAQYDDPLLAVICGSHCGEDEHVGHVLRGLSAEGLTADALAKSLAASNEERLRHQCSGNHMGFLVAAVRNGWPLTGYWNRTHPSQIAAHEAVASASGLGLKQVPTFLDSCGVITFALSLGTIASMYARLPKTDPAQFTAMCDNPELVSGQEHRDARIMRAIPGSVAKSGSEALQAIALSHEGLGIAVRIEDGGERAVSPATMTALSQCLTGMNFGPLEDLAEPKETLRGGTETVSILRAELRLKFL